MSAKVKKVKKVEVRKPIIERGKALRIIRTVPTNEVFHFYKGIDQPTGKFATSLADFCEKVRMVNIGSVNFHLKRGDFEKWFRETIGDGDLARRVNTIAEQAPREKLRDEIYRVVRNRINELKTL